MTFQAYSLDEVELNERMDPIVSGRDGMIFQRALSIDLTSQFYLDAVEKLNSNQNIYVLVRGATGTGKSSDGQAMAIFFTSITRTPFGIRTNISFSNNQLLEQIDMARNKNRLKGATFVRDESPRKGRIGCLEENTEILVKIRDDIKSFKIKDLFNKTNVRYNLLSLNINTKKIQDDWGRVLDSGIKDVFRITTEDGDTVEATNEHPFFVLKNNEVIEKRLDKLKVGDKIIKFI